MRPAYRDSGWMWMEGRRFSSMIASYVTSLAGIYIINRSENWESTREGSQIQTKMKLHVSTHMPVILLPTGREGDGGNYIRRPSEFQWSPPSGTGHVYRYRRVVLGGGLKRDGKEVLERKRVPWALAGFISGCYYLGWFAHPGVYVHTSVST